MPEPNFLAMYSFNAEPPKKAPIIKLSCGIGDTDGFPAFDVDSDAYAVKDDSTWGFLITGGAEFHMPLTVFQVTPDGLADKGGIRLGDIILEINEEDATELTLSQAHEKINASGKKVHFLVKTMEEDPMEEFEVGEEKSIVLRVPKPVPPPPGASIEARLRAMQRKLSEIAEIPKILSSTLATVSETFEKLHLNGGGITPNSTYPSNEQYQQKRKFSYDEDAYDYELSDEEGDGDGDGEGEGNGDVNENFNAKEAYLRLKQHVARQRRSKEVTPESDYASENNYSLHGANEDLARENDDNENNDDADDDYDKEANDPEYETSNVEDDDGKENFNLSHFLASQDFANNPNKSRSEGDGNDEDYGKTETHEEYANVDNAVDDDEDFLTTTFTWSIPNKSKLRLNANSVTDSRSHVPSNRENNYTCFDSVDDCNVREVAAIEKRNQSEECSSKQPKLDKFWPWADREKIIYKQSTCHLVPKKPLGLIEKRIQLLAKHNLLEHLGPNNKGNNK
ncbi:uncharacterized protein LOC142238502 isoform X1 [Haematobia irritans]|uniref:uncharacterized protein LOC142238502 isoform X1 n=1 Tax=Haematobia irritans TaxID=7368 RepID=UPI003F50C57B